VKLTIQSTSKVVHLNGVPARIWEGTTESGIPVIAFITRVGVANDADCTEFERELQEQSAPSPAAQAIDARLVL
jgi:hypothetical protein